MGFPSIGKTSQYPVPQFQAPAQCFDKGIPAQVGRCDDRQVAELQSCSRYAPNHGSNVARAVLEGLLGAGAIVVGAIAHETDELPKIPEIADETLMAAGGALLFFSIWDGISHHGEPRPSDVRKHLFSDMNVCSKAQSATLVGALQKSEYLAPGRERKVLTVPTAQQVLEVAPASVPLNQEQAQQVADALGVVRELK